MLPTLLLPLVLFTLTPVVELEHPITNHVLFVMDVSGSMTELPTKKVFGVPIPSAGTPFDAAVDCMNQLLDSPSDDMRFGVIAFGSFTTRWDGDSDGWATLPSADAMASANRWIRDQTANGSTNVYSALHDAFTDPQEDLTIILVTDGEFSDLCGTTAIAGWQGARSQPAVFVVVGVNPSPSGTAKIQNLAPHGWYNYTR